MVQSYFKQISDDTINYIALHEIERVVINPESINCFLKSGYCFRITGSDMSLFLTAWENYIYRCEAK